MEPGDWPNGSWAEASNMATRWGVESRYFSNAMCPNDQHGCWCAGRPFTNDPEFTPYPPSLDTYMTYGPINLAGMTAAGCSFWLFNRSEPAHDSIFWGASLSANLTAQNMMLAGSYSGEIGEQLGSQVH